MHANNLRVVRDGTRDAARRASILTFTAKETAIEYQKKKKSEAIVALAGRGGTG